MKNFKATIELMNECLREMYGENACFYKDKEYSNAEIYCTDEISGDWKHTHLYIDAIVKDVLGSYKDSGASLFKVNHYYTEDTGSDWGPAIHMLILMKTEDSEDRIEEKVCERFEEAVVWYEAREGIISWKDAEARVWGE